MNTIPLCAVAMSSTINELIHQISLCRNMSQYVEVRFDYLNNQTNIDLSLFKKATDQTIIFTCRRQDEGGKWNGSEENRIHILQNAFDFGFLVDVELQTLEEGKLQLTSQMQKNAITSFHNFEKTPPFNELEKVNIRMEKYEPAIKKIATMIQNETDIKTLYGLLCNKRDKEKLCIIGMGKMGKQTRIISPLLGSYLTYCSINNEVSAPGQMNCKDMKEIYKLIQ